MTNLKEQIIHAKDRLGQVDVQSLQAYYFENPTDEETAWLLVEPKAGVAGQSKPFEVSAIAFLRGKDFMKEQALEGLQHEAFAELDAQQALSIIACTPFAVPKEVRENLEKTTAAIAVYNDWDYRIFMLQSPGSKMCFAWTTTA